MKTFAATLLVLVLASSLAFASGKCGTNVGRNSNTSTPPSTPVTGGGDGAGIHR